MKNKKKHQEQEELQRNLEKKGKLDNEEEVNTVEKNGDFFHDDKSDDDEIDEEDKLF